jgi:alkylated DNA repair dioxygenase AlkB
MPDSLFGSDDEQDDSGQPQTRSPAQAALNDDVLIASSSSCPPIPGLYILRRAVPQPVLDDLADALSSTVWPGSTDQVMLFTSPETPSLPPYLEPFVDLLPRLLENLPDSVKHAVLHARMPVQAILNCYHPGQGISAHVDLPERYADGIVGLSLLSSTVMEFRRAKADPPGTRPTAAAAAAAAYAVRLRPGDVYVLSGEARWDWTHEIPYRDEDLVEDENGRTMRVRRGLRLSVTLRRMKDGGDVLR